MKRYLVTYVKNGYVVSCSVQTAESSEKALEYSRMYHPIPRGTKPRVTDLEQIQDYEGETA